MSARGSSVDLGGRGSDHPSGHGEPGRYGDLAGLLPPVVVFGPVALVSLAPVAAQATTVIVVLMDLVPAVLMAQVVLADTLALVISTALPARGLCW